MSDEDRTTEGPPTTQGALGQDVPAEDAPVTAPAPAARRPTPPAGPFGSLARHVAVGASVAAVLAATDVSVGAARANAVGLSWTDRLVALANTASMLAPAGVLSGVSVALLLLVAAQTPWFEGWRRTPHGPKALFRPNPEAFASALGICVAVFGYATATSRAMRHFATRYHDPQLASWAMSAFSLALVVSVVFLAATVRVIALPIARRLPRVASLGLLALFVLAGASAALLGLVARAPMLLRAYDPVMLAYAPGVCLLYGLLALVFGRYFAERPTRRLALFLLGLSIAGLTWTGATYGDRNRVRAAVEHESVIGRPLLRVYLALTDRDGDGHAFAFGGGDCDDGDPDVHPGALDNPGDGIDADCFDGDGSREVADFGTGHYAPRPSHIVRPNILLISVDALRPDHLGCYGYERPTSPNIDEFCAQAVRFDRVIAQSSRSIRSIPAVFTGRYPSQVAYGSEYLWPSLRRENQTFSEALRARGYRTVVTMGTDYFTRVDGFFQGFEEANQIPVYRPARARPVDESIRQLDTLIESNRPWLLWTHLFNVHERYLWDRTPSRFGRELVDEYDTEIVLADEQVGRLLAHLSERGAADNTVVVFMSDHGEAFSEHGHTGHSQALYNEEVYATLMIRAPSVAPRVVEGPVALFDVMPTILNLAGVPLPEPVPARSLVGPMTGAPLDPERLIFTELMPDGLYPYDQKAIYRGNQKLIYWTREGTYQLFDLATDPHEQHDLSDERRDEARELLGLLRAWIAQTHLPQNRTEDIVTEARLAAEPANMTARLDAQFPGMFTLLGYDLPETTFRPGERIAVDFYYRVDASITKDLFFYVNIEGPAGYPVPPHFHAHHYPIHGRYRTTDWRPGEILRDSVQMVIPRDIRHPVELRVTLTVLDAQFPVEYRTPTGAGVTIEVGRVQIR
ncbi:MAG: sulfatase-like hydrolase/transferase [Polyangiales bacterium]